MGCFESIWLFVIILLILLTLLFIFTIIPSTLPLIFTIILFLIFMSLAARLGLCLPGGRFTVRR